VNNGTPAILNCFIFLYFVTVSFLTFAMLLTGLDFDSAFSAVVASINNTAHGFGAPGAVHNLHSLSMLQTWICSAAMLLGRLEIFSIVVLMRPAYWRANRRCRIPGSASLRGPSRPSTGRPSTGRDLP
jgi:trk system potassium uptake protein TrkH